MSFNNLTAGQATKPTSLEAAPICPRLGPLVVQLQSLETWVFLLHWGLGLIAQQAAQLAPCPPSGRVVCTRGSLLKPRWVVLE